ncbi:MAG: septum formation initiator family protein [Pyrinomonadaceae bacterium]|nr:septum formation initiator family protein [Pyrinomonadaceae bacterium]
MNKAANTYWTDTRLAAQRPLPRAITVTPARGSAIAHAREETQSRRASRSPFVAFSVIMLTLFVFCVSISLRTQAEVQAAALRHETLNMEVEILRNTNSALEQQMRRLRTDPRAIEATARERLGMVRRNEIIVPAAQ